MARVARFKQERQAAHHVHELVAAHELTAAAALTERQGGKEQRGGGGGRPSHEPSVQPTLSPASGPTNSWPTNPFASHPSTSTTNPFEAEALPDQMSRSEPKSATSQRALDLRSTSACNPFSSLRARERKGTDADLRYANHNRPLFPCE